METEALEADREANRRAHADRRAGIAPEVEDPSIALEADREENREANRMALRIVVRPTPPEAPASKRAAQKTKKKK